MRLFVALDLPIDIKKQLNKICYGLSGVRWVSMEQMHITLRFIGDADHRQFESIQAALGKIAFKPLSVSLKGVGQFPPKGAAHVLWAGVEAPDDLTALAKQVNKAIDALGFAPEEHEFTPHVTLARMKPPLAVDKVRGYMSKHQEFQTAAFKIDRMTVFSSLLAPGGSTYRTEAEFKAK